MPSLQPISPDELASVHVYPLALAPIALRLSVRDSRKRAYHRTSDSGDHSEHPEESLRRPIVRLSSSVSLPDSWLHLKHVETDPPSRCYPIFVCHTEPIQQDFDRVTNASDGSFASHSIERTLEHNRATAGGACGGDLKLRYGR
jgi:hypothetical protein